MEHQKKPNKISEIVRLQRILKKWKKLANAPKPTHTHTNSSTTTTISKSSSSCNLNTSTSKSIKFLKKTLSFSDRDHDTSSFTSFNANNDVVPKGYLAVCVGKELKRFIIPTEYLGHQAFGILLREAEEEFGFRQEGVLKIPCDVPLFEKIVKMVQEKREVFFLHDPSNCFVNDDLMNTSSLGCYSPDQSSCEITPTSHHAQLCR